METPLKPEKIAVLGGGMSSLTAVFALTSQPNWQEKYDITVYQLGWRLGGKGASGRNMTSHNQQPPNYRIEEHGVHVWFGFYENAFRLIQECYQELKRPPEHSLATWEEVFKPHSFLVIEESINGTRIPWAFEFPMNAQVPGSGNDVFLNLWGYVRKSINWLDTISLNSLYSKEKNEQNFFTQFLEKISDFFPQFNIESKPEILTVIQAFVNEVEYTTLNLGSKLLHLITQLINLWGEEELNSEYSQNILLFLLRQFLDWLWDVVSSEIEENIEIRRLYILSDLVLTNIIGIIEDKLIADFDSIDDFDYREWLKKHGAREYPTLQSAPMRTLYNLSFAYLEGNPQKPNYAAGTVLRGLLRGLFTYKGAILWKMQAGMGDTVFAPLYLVLKQRGVKFEFFHRIENLGLSDDKKSIVSIDIAKQVNIVAEEYQPLINVKGLPCFPSEPLYNQIENGEMVREVNLESFYSRWQNVEKKTLHYKQDFDTVILGIPIAALPFICSELLEVSQEWRDMTDKIKTVSTQSLQLWLKPSVAALGWSLWSKPSPILDADVEPFDTWVDMTQVRAWENWSSENYPSNISYFCSVFPDTEQSNSPLNFKLPQEVYKQARKNAIYFLNQDMTKVWVQAKTSSGFNWNLLVDPSNSQGENRIDSQYLRVNIDPSERYVLSVAGSTKYRLKTDESGFDNLYLTGDWINNGFNSGCIEAATISGLQTARAISGYPTQIIGENF